MKQKMAFKSRRHAGFLASMLALAWAGTQAGAALVSGTVFLDANGNGIFDSGESGMAGVAVTDGATIVVSGQNGQYEIDAQLPAGVPPGEAAIVSCSFPSGTWPTNGWFRRAEPEGQPLNFGLRRQEQQTPFVFVHGTDSHVPRGGEHLFAQFREEMSELSGEAAFCILTGDLVDLADRRSLEQAEQEYDFFSNHAEGFPLPLFCTPGNHEPAGVANAEADPLDSRYGYGLFWRRAGPLRWSFDYAGVHFVGIDYNIADGGQWSWGVPAEAAEWLQKDLARIPKNARILLFVHYPSGPARFRETVASHAIESIFSGHSHKDIALEFEGVSVLLSGALAQIAGDRLPGYRIVRVLEDGFDSFYKELGDDHSIALNAPRGDEPIGPRAVLRGAFADRMGEIVRATARLGEASAPLDIERTPIACRFEAELDLSREEEGFRPLAITLESETQAFEWQRDFLALTGKRTPLAHPADAQLQLEIAGADREIEVNINGFALGRIGPTALQGQGPFRPPIKNAETFSLPMEKTYLRRLNRIALKPMHIAPNRIDAFCALDVRLICAEREYRDPRFRFGPFYPRSADGELVYYIDLAQ